MSNNKICYSPCKNDATHSNYDIVEIIIKELFSKGDLPPQADSPHIRGQLFKCAFPHPQPPTTPNRPDTSKMAV